VADLEAGKPLEVALRAAVLAGQQNLDASLRAAPLPPTLRPTPERLVLKVKPVDLSPLAPFAPAAVGFLGGWLQADLQATLGALGGGSGPATLKGTLTARGLRFRGQEGGRPLDVNLDADVAADTKAGDLRIGKLDLAVGPAGLTGHGSASGLFGDSPRIEGLEVVSRNLDLAALAAYYPPLRKQLGGRISGPIALSLRAAGAAERPTLELRIDLGPARLSVPRQLAKAAGAPAVLTARISGGGNAARVELGADLAGLDLRPGGSLAKVPGERLGLAAVARYRAAGATRTVELDRLDVLFPMDAITGKGRVELAGSGERQTTRFDLSLTSQRLDLDRLLLPTPAKPEGKPQPGEKQQPTDPRAFAGLSGTAEARVAQLKLRGAQLQDAVLRLKLEGDLLTIEQLTVHAFGGDLVASGSHLRLAHPDQPMKLMAKAKHVDVGQLLALYTPRKVLAGRADFDVDLAAAARGDVAKSLAGSLGGRLLEGSFLGKDLVAGVAAPLAAALPSGLAKKLADGGTTTLGKELPFNLQIKDGLARITKPMRVSTPRATLAVEGGGVRLDGTLDVPLTVGLLPDTIAALTGGKVRPSAPIPVTLRLTGPAWSPTLSGVEVASAVQAIVQQAGTAALQKAIGGKLGGALGGALGAPGEAAPQNKAEAEAKGRKAAEDAKAKAVDEAKKKLQGLFR
jgi:AsmA protein